MSPITLVGAGILLFGLGLGLGYLLSHFLRKREATKACDIQNELDEYRRRVTGHFSETAQHFQELGQQYQSLYKHMAHGAEALCDPAQTDAMLEFPAGDVQALTANVDEREDVPEPIKDYAPAEEDESLQAKAKAEEPETPESPVESAAADETAEKPAAEEEIADAVGNSTPDETERTVH